MIWGYMRLVFSGLVAVHINEIVLAGPTSQGVSCYDLNHDELNCNKHQYIQSYKMNGTQISFPAYTNQGYVYLVK